MNNIDTTQIKTPNIYVSDEALSQLQLILDCDYTLIDKFVRIQVSGKGCGGFDYSINISPRSENDIVVEKYSSDKKIKIIFVLDPFTAFYFQLGTIEYQLDLESGSDGFIVKNLEENKFQGKFWQNDPNKIPPLVKNSLSVH